MPVYWDLGVLHLPVRDSYARALRSGENFDWLPGMHNGVFITGEGEHGPYHPLHLLLYRLLPLPTAFTLEVVLPFAFSFAGMVLFLRRHVGTPGAFLAALVYTFSANNVSHSFHPNFVAVMAHLPWLLWVEEGLFLDTGLLRLRAIAGIALLTGSQILLGHPQAMSYSLLAEALYVLFLLPSTVHPWRAAAGWAAAKAIGALIGSVQLLATLSFLANSNRSSFDPFGGSLPPQHLLEFLVPSILVGHAPGWLLEPAYIGAVPLLLAVWYVAGMIRNHCASAVQVPKDGKEKRLGWYALALGVLATWLALGRYGGLYRLQTLLPVVGQFRAPARYLNLLDFSLAILTGLALQLLSKSIPGETSWRRLTGPWAMTIAAVIAALAFRHAYPGGDEGGFSTRFVTGAVVFLAAAGLLAAAVRRRGVASCALVLFTGWDLFHFSLSHPLWGLSLWKETVTLTEYLDGAKVPPSLPGRCLDHSWNGMRTMLRGVRLVNGYIGGIEPKKRLDYQQVDALRLSAASWYRERDFLQPDPISGLEPASGGWHRVPQLLPRVRLVTEAVPSSTPALDLPHLHLETAALTETPLDLDPGPGGDAVLIEDLPGRLAVEVAAPGRQLLVVAESHDPGWQASIDGAASPVLRVNGDFLGCLVGPGRHNVVFRFAPRCVAWGRALSLAGLAATLLLGAAGLRRRVGRAGV
jgi:hypothetical protein